MRNGAGEDRDREKNQGKIIHIVSFTMMQLMTDKMWVATEHENILICIETAGKIIGTLIIYRI